jgi:hypothetical protein
MRQAMLLSVLLSSISYLSRDRPIQNKDEHIVALGGIVMFEQQNIVDSIGNNKYIPLLASTGEFKLLQWLL